MAKDWFYVSINRPFKETKHCEIGTFQISGTFTTKMLEEEKREKEIKSECLKFWQEIPT